MRAPQIIPLEQAAAAAAHDEAFGAFERVPEAAGGRVRQIVTFVGRFKCVYETGLGAVSEYCSRTRGVFAQLFESILESRRPV